MAYALDNADERNQETNSKARLIASIAVVLPLIIALYHYLPHIIDAFAFDLLKLNPESHLGAAVNFFFTIP